MINRSIIVCVLFLINLNVSSQIINSISGKTLSEDWKKLNEKDYTISYPANWFLNKPGSYGRIFNLNSARLSSDDFFIENIGLAIQNLKGLDMSLDKFVEISENEISKFITNGKLIESIRISENGNEYHKIVFTGDQGVYKLIFEQIYWIKKDKAYILTFSCEQNQYENFKEIAEKILFSFKLK